MIFIDYAPCESCKNPDTFGMTCVKCGECKCYSYSLMQYTPVMPPYCSKCGALNGRKEL